MNSFPEGFNSESDLIKLKEQYHMNDLRERIYKHIITNGNGSNLSSLI